MKWIVIGVVVLAVGFLWFAGQPARARKRAVAEALARAKANLAQKPGDLSAEVALAKVQLELAGDAQTALTTLKRIDSLHPHHWDGDEKPTKMIIGEAHVALGELDRAIEVFQSFIDTLDGYETGGDSERKWKLETHKVDSEQRIRLLKKGDTHVHQPEQWGDAAS